MFRAVVPAAPAVSPRVILSMRSRYPPSTDSHLAAGAQLFDQAEGEGVLLCPHTYDSFASVWKGRSADQA